MTSSELITLEGTLKSPEFQKELQQSTSFKLNMATQCMFALDAIKKSPYLQKCTVDSVKESIQNVALLGLTLNPNLAQAYLIPRKDKCCLDLGYQGMITKLVEYGAAKEAFAQVIYEGDDFEFDFARNKVAKYVPYHVLKKDKGEEIGVFAAAARGDDYYQYVYLPIERVNQIMNGTEAYKFAKKKKDAGEWSSTIWEGDNRGEMIKKTAIRYLWKMMPKNDNYDDIGTVMSLHDDANAQTDTTFMDDGNEIRTKPMTSTTATENKMKDVNKKKDIQDAVVVADEIVDGAAEELIELLNEGYKLPDSGIRALNEVKEMEGLLSERGFSESLLKEAFGNGGKVIKKYQDLMYRGDTETMLPYVINKAYELYLAKQKQD